MDTGENNTKAKVELYYYTILKKAPILTRLLFVYSQFLLAELSEAALLTSLVGEVAQNVSESKQFSFYQFDSCVKMQNITITRLIKMKQEHTQSPESEQLLKLMNRPQQFRH